MSSEVFCIESDDDDICIVSSSNKPNPSEVIVLDSEHMTNGNVEAIIHLDEPVVAAASASTSSAAVDPAPSPPVKRIQPTLVSTEVTSPSKKKEFGEDDGSERTQKRKKVTKAVGTTKSFKRTPITQLSETALDLDGNASDEDAPTISVDADEPMKVTPVAPVDEKITKEFRKLIQTCKSVDESKDMEKLIRKKLIGYYRDVPLEFVESKSFRDMVTSVTEEIKKAPHLIYLKITRIIEELKPRRRTVLVKQEIVEPTPSDGGQAAQNNSTNGEQVTVVSQEELKMNAKKTAQIKKLNKALAQLKKRIDELDQEEVDFDEDMNSAHMKVERYKKRACQIYEKICDISGESKHAQRSVRKPIKFHGTIYPEFNKTLQAFVNRTNIFPDFFDVKKCLDHCNKQYNMQLRQEEVKIIAQDAFVKVGKILQKRRKMDLYEMISYFAGSENDPADEDADLLDKLGKNKQHHTKISDLIDKFADQQASKDAEVNSSEDEGNEANDKTETGDNNHKVPLSLDESEVKKEPLRFVKVDPFASDDEDVDKTIMNQSLDLFNDVELDEAGKEDKTPAEARPSETPSPAPSMSSLPLSGDRAQATSTPTEEPLQVTNMSTSSSISRPCPPNPNALPVESVNMDEAIEYMVSNSIDPFAMSAIDDMMLLPGFPMDTGDDDKVTVE